MEINELYAQYCRFWELFKAIPKYRNRRACSFTQWRARDDAAREAMLDYLEKNGPPPKANPYFWIQDFDEPEPQWLTGQGQEKALRDGFIVCICLDASKPSNPRMRPIELNEARHFKLPCLRFEFIDQESGRLIHRDHTALDFTHLPMMPKKGN